MRNNGAQDYLGGGSIRIDWTDKDRGPRYFLREKLDNQKENKKLNKLGIGQEMENFASFGSITFTVSVEPTYAEKKEPRWLTIDVLEAKDLCPLLRKGDYWIHDCCVVSLSLNSTRQILCVSESILDII